MNIFIRIFIRVLIVTILTLFIEREDSKRVLKEQKDFGKISLVVGILSAQKNFEQRKAIRKTWFDEVERNPTVRAWFIVGKNFCEIAPEYRLSKYGCEKWQIDLSGIDGNLVSFKEIIPSTFSPVLSKGFSFQVNHPIVVTKLGILSKLLPSNGTAGVVLLDLQSKETFAETSIALNITESCDGFIYGEIEPILLPKGYQGLIIAEGFANRPVDAAIKWNTGGVVTIRRVYRSTSHLDSVDYSADCLVPASFQFFVQDIQQLKDIVNSEKQANKDWRNSSVKVQQKLIEESARYHDILFADVVDTYRNLPVKLLQFITWLVNNKNFSYIMKVDDDSVIDLKYLHSIVINNPIFDPYTHWIWSRFRKDWPLNHVGKWTDSEYKCSLYPEFPCGSGYAMSHATAAWLALNAHALFPYQGEDVSMGIWLSAINPTLLEDKNWSCDAKCEAHGYNAAELSVEGIYKSWLRFRECRSFCACDTLI